jgi:mono/diheme cytochrome c family protein
VSVRIWLLILNIVVLLGLAVFAFSSLRKHPEAKQPENLERFLDDDDLEGRRLERVLGWALLFAAVTAVALPLYWLREPDRQSDSENYFNEGAISRGQTLFAGVGQPGYDATKSLQCANCHGVKGVGGTKQTTFDPDGDGGIKPMQVVWKVPALNTELLRFSEEEVNHIITYGRPGTPMQAWGIEGGGPKNDQSINDLVAYIKSIQLTPEKAKAEAAQALKDAKAQPAQGVKDAQKALADAKQAQKDAIKNQQTVNADPKSTPKQKQDAQVAVDAAPDNIAAAQESLDWALAWQRFRANVSDGQLLFEINCARCHTKGWSAFDPTQVNGTEILGLPGGQGTIGPNLREGAEVRRFPGQTGFDDHVTFVGTGSEANQQYGQNGEGTGNMPGFSNMLTKDMIEQIVHYERGVIDSTNYDVPFSGSNTIPTTTTPSAGG